MLILGLESSCDDTSAAVLKDGSQVLSNIVSSQDEIHARFGGVVPELASRQHLQALQPVMNEALFRADVSLNDIDLIAVTQGPGLIGSLLVGFSFAKALSQARKIPYIGVDHMAGHLLSVFLDNPKLNFPYIALIVSGGTSSLFLCHDFTQFQLLGRTRDDAAGEAFDKTAKILGLGYPGGPEVSSQAQQGDPASYRFPRAWLEPDSLDFSFSGLKTAVLNCRNKIAKEALLPVADICASFQEAVIDVLVSKTLLAAEKCNVSTIVLGGGVSANNRLREAMERKCAEKEYSFYSPHLQFCTDNAAMIALAGFHKYTATGLPSSYDEDVFSRSKLG